MNRSTAALLLVLVCRSWPSCADDLDRYGLTIIDRDLSHSIAPKLQRPDRPVAIWDVHPPEEQECKRLVAEAFDVYPPTLIRALVKRLVLAGDIYIWNRPVGGMQETDLIAINCIQPFNNADLIPDGIHDAIAGLVSNVAPPDWTAWEAGNRPGFFYGNEDAYKAELGSPDARDVLSRLNADGFISRYGLTGKLPDFQTYAEQVFGNGSQFAVLARRYPPMRRKLAVLLNTYLVLAPSLRAYFDQTGLMSAAALVPSQDAASAHVQPVPNR